MSEPDHDDAPILDIAHGDPGLSRHLRACLKVLREKNDDPDFRRLVDDVLDGRRSLRDVCHLSAFTNALNVWVATFAETYDQLSDEEISDLAAQGRRQLDGNQE